MIERKELSKENIGVYDLRIKEEVWSGFSFCI